MKTLLAASLLVLSCTVSGFSQTSADYSATLKKMFAVSGSEETFKSVVSQMFVMFKQNKNVPDDVWADLEKEFLKTSMDQLAEMLAPVYEKHLTQSDLEQVIKFYESPVGAKFAAKNPIIMQESMQVGQQWGAAIGRQFEERLKEKGY